MLKPQSSRGVAGAHPPGDTSLSQSIYGALPPKYLFCLYTEIVTSHLCLSSPSTVTVGMLADI